MKTTKLFIPNILLGISFLLMSVQSYVATSTADAATGEEIMLAIENMVRSNPDREVLMGGYCLNEHFGESCPEQFEPRCFTRSFLCRDTR